jgi:hypothetical protein
MALASLALPGRCDIGAPPWSRTLISRFVDPDPAEPAQRN